MIRFVLVMAVVFALPFIVWRIASAVRSEEAASAPTGKLMMIGGALALISMVVLAALSIEKYEYDGAYQPARLEDGEVRPGGFERRDPDSDPDQPSLRR